MDTLEKRLKKEEINAIDEKWYFDKRKKEYKELKIRMKSISIDEFNKEYKVIYQDFKKLSAILSEKKELVKKTMQNLNISTTEIVSRENQKKMKDEANIIELWYDTGVKRCSVTLQKKVLKTRCPNFTWERRNRMTKEDYIQVEEIENGYFTFNDSISLIDKYIKTNKLLKPLKEKKRRYKELEKKADRIKEMAINHIQYARHIKANLRSPDYLAKVKKEYEVESKEYKETRTNFCSKHDITSEQYDRAYDDGVPYKDSTRVLLDSIDEGLKIEQYHFDLALESIDYAIQNNARSYQMWKEDDIGKKKFVRMAIRTHERHTCTNYDKLLKKGFQKEEARYISEGENISMFD